MVHIPWRDLISAPGAAGGARPAALETARWPGMPQPAAADDAGPFFTPPRIATAPRPTCVQSADLDADGHLDLVVAEHMGPTVTVFYGDGSGAFPSLHRIEFAARPTWTAPHDMNGDGRLDLVTAFWNQPTQEGLIRIAYNDGGRAWSLGPWDSTGVFPVCIAIADWNRDGLPDAATADYMGASATLLRNFGDGHLRPVATLRASAWAASAAFADLDADGSAELLVAGDGCNLADRYRYVGGDTWLADDPIGVQWEAYSVASADFDRARGPDVVIGSGNGAASVLFNDGAARFTSWTDYPTHSAPVHLLTPDLDADGTADLVTSHYVSSVLTPMWNRGPAGFVPVASSEPGGTAAGYLGGIGVAASAAGDFDEDGILDLATVDSGVGTVSLLFGLADGSFAACRSFATGSYSYAHVVADFDRDGIPDVATALAGADRVAVLRGRADGSFAQQVQYPTHDEPASIAVGDLDGDGAPDLVAGNRRSHDVSVLLNRGDGTFLPRTDYPVASLPYGVAIGEIHGDGRPDIAAACYGGDVVHLLVNKGGGQFASGPQQPRAGNGPSSVMFLDCNGDGRDELAATNYAEGSVTTWHNIGNGAFGPPARIATVPGAFSLTTIRLAPGSRPALVSANRGDNRVSVIELTEGALLARIRSYAVGINPACVATGDFDADGDEDLAVVNYTSGSLLVLEGDAGGFRTTQLLPLGRAPAWITPIDRDGDGIGDVLVSMVDDRTLIEVRARANGPPGAPVSVPAGRAPELALAAPFPNPTRGSLRIAFSVPLESRGSLAVVDVSGREVARLRDGAFAAGPGAATWDGRDRAGRAVRSGVYFLVLEAGDRRATARFTVMR